MIEDRYRTMGAGEIADLLDKNELEGRDFFYCLYRAMVLLREQAQAVPGPLAEIQRLLQIMLASAKTLGGEWVEGYQIKTGALHQILGVMQEAGFPVSIPLPQPAVEVLAEFQKAMRDEVIPGIVQTMSDRADAGATTANLPLSAAPPAVALTDIVAERKRQVEKKGWDQGHDDEHTGCELSCAAACYAVGRPDPRYWPLDWHFKDGDMRRKLVKAGALIVAEIERLDRAAPTPPANPPETAKG